MASSEKINDALKRAAEAIKNAQALIIMAGAGMGVDSGLPDFRGPQGFWRAYPLLQKRGIQLTGMSNPVWFEDDPEFAWWFFGHRYNMYATTKPHAGFGILKQWADRMKKGYFVFTSNVDGHFQRAGFDGDRVVECHGSIHFMQCRDEEANSEIWPVDSSTKYELDMENMKMISPLPTGPPGAKEQLPARPNILMFGDFGWVSRRTMEQEARLENFLKEIKQSIPFVVVEIGAGLAVPTVRAQSQTMVHSKSGTLIRINPNEPEIPHNSERHVSLPMKGLDALKAIDKLLSPI